MTLRDRLQALVSGGQLTEARRTAIAARLAMMGRRRLDDLSDADVVSIDVQPGSVEVVVDRHDYVRVLLARAPDGSLALSVRDEP